MQHDVFISYSHKLKVLVDKIVSELEHNKVKCWYAPRDVIGDYATSIVDAIEKAKIFVVILDGESSNSVHVLNEVEIAYKRIVEEDANLIIMPFKINDEALSKAMEYYVRRMHWIDASSSSIDNAINELVVKIKTIINPKIAIIIPIMLNFPPLQPLHSVKARKPFIFQHLISLRWRQLPL